MGDHDTWFSVLPFWSQLEEQFQAGLQRDWEWMMFGETHFTLLHVGSAIIAVILLIVASLAYRNSIADDTEGVVPVEGYGLAAMADGFMHAIYSTSCDIMGEDNAKRYLPFVGTLALFIFANNIQGLVPGFLPGTDTLKTNAVLALSVFVVYNVIGIREQGLHYLAHFLGPSFSLWEGGPSIPWLAPLMLPIELVSHIARPISLSLRLMGNILADHKVVGVITALTWFTAVLVPVPFLLLGVVVSIVQTAVFTMLTMIYIGEAAAHADEH